MNVFFLWEWEAWGEVGAVGAMCTVVSDVCDGVFECFGGCGNSGIDMFLFCSLSVWVRRGVWW